MGCGVAAKCASDPLTWVPRASRAAVHLDLLEAPGRKRVSILLDRGMRADSATARNRSRGRPHAARCSCGRPDACPHTLTCGSGERPRDAQRGSASRRLRGDSGAPPSRLAFGNGRMGRSRQRRLRIGPLRWNRDAPTTGQLSPGPQALLTPHHGGAQEGFILTPKKRPGPLSHSRRTSNTTSRHRSNRALPAYPGRDRPGPINSLDFDFSHMPPPCFPEHLLHFPRLTCPFVAITRPAITTHTDQPEDLRIKRTTRQ